MKYITRQWGLLCLVFLAYVALPPVQAAEVLPEWLPVDGSLENYRLIYANSTEIENVVCNVDNENMTVYFQLWNLNNSANEVQALIGQLIIDLPADYMAAKVDTHPLHLDMLYELVTDYDPVVDGDTRWDLFVFALNDLLGTDAIDCADELGWDRAIKVLDTQSSALYRSLVIGTIDNRFIVSFGMLRTDDGFFAHPFFTSVLTLLLLVGVVGLGLSMMMCEDYIIGEPTLYAIDQPADVSSKLIPDTEYTNMTTLLNFNTLFGDFIAEFPTWAIVVISVLIGVGLVVGVLVYRKKVCFRDPSRFLCNLLTR